MPTPASKYTEQDLMDAYAQGWNDCVDEMSAPWTGNLKPIRWMGGNRAERYVEHLREEPRMNTIYYTIPVDL